MASADSHHGPQLPFEVWTLISQYIPKDELRQLYPVNAALFEISMNLRYGSVSIHNNQSDLGASPWLTRLQTQIHAQRVRKFCLRTTALIESSPSSSLFPISSLPPPSIPYTRRIAHNTIKLLTFGARRKSTLDLASAYYPKRVQTALLAVANLTNVTSYHLALGTTHAVDADQRIPLPVVNAAWNTFGHILRSLTLELSLEAFSYFIPPDLDLPELNELTLKLSFQKAPSSNRLPPELQNIVASFVNNRTSLTSLTIDCSDIHNNTPLLQPIQRLPLLRRLSFSLCFGVELTGIRHILSIHSDIITDLEIVSRTTRPEGTRTLYSQLTWFYVHSEINFPNLRRLTLGFPTGHENFPLLMRFANTRATSLTSLTLHQVRLTETQVEDVAQAFVGTQQSLESLDIFIDFLTPKCLSTLAMSLPNLRNLSLSFLSYKLSTGSQGDSPEVEAFEEALAEHLNVLGSWLLDDLVLDTYPETKESERLKDVVASKIPSLTAVNGKTLAYERNEECDAAFTPPMHCMG